MEGGRISQITKATRFIV